MSGPTFSKSIQKRIEHQTGEKLYTQAEVDAKVASAKEATVEQCYKLVRDWNGSNLLLVRAIRALVKTPGNLATFEAEIRRQERERVMIEVKSWPYVPFGTYEQWCLFIESKLPELTAPPTAASDGAGKSKS